MTDMEAKAIEEAQKDFLKFKGKGPEFLIEKYMDFSNQQTIMLEEIDDANLERLSDNDFYTIYYSDEMVKQLSWALADSLLYGLGHEKDKKGLWKKKRKGLFR